jgi:hypothetical protein
MSIGNRDYTLQQTATTKAYRKANILTIERRRVDNITPASYTGVAYSNLGRMTGSEFSLQFPHQMLEQAKAALCKTDLNH